MFPSNLWKALSTIHTKHLSHFMYLIAESIINTSTSKQKEGTSLRTTNTSPSKMMSPSNVIQTATSTLVSVMSSNLGQPSEKQSNSDSVLDSSTKSTAKTGVSSSLIHSSASGLPHFTNDSDHETLYPSKCIPLLDKTTVDSR